MRIIIIIFLCIISSALFAQKQLVKDTASVVTVRTFSDSSINAYKADKQFQYTQAAMPAESWWDRFWDWFWQMIGNVFEKGGSTLWIILATLCLAGIIFAFWKTGGNKMGLFDKNNKGKLGYEIGEENIHSISFDEAIQKAVDGGNFRLAVRLLYLQNLKLLNDKEIINWHLNKTNFVYVREMNNHPLQSFFAKLTNSFEYAWYGNKPVTKENFAQVKEDFCQFQHQL